MMPLRLLTNFGKRFSRAKKDSSESLQPDIAFESTLTTEHPNDDKFRILSLDGGGSKGFYTLGILREIEAMLNCPLYKRFDLIFGTSTGSIIAALIALGYEIDQIHDLYKKHVPEVMKPKRAKQKSAALEKLAKDIFKEKDFTDVKTGVGIVTTKWILEKPMIFKGHPAQAHGSAATFVPGFGVKIADAVQASCSAVPFFERKAVETSTGDRIELIDGGYCANNPTMYAIADAVFALRKPKENIRVVSLGVGGYPAKSRKKTLFEQVENRMIGAVELLQKTLEVNTQSMEQLRAIIFREVPTVRIHDSFTSPEMATDFLEHDLEKLNLLRQRGRESFAGKETILREYLMS